MCKTASSVTADSTATPLPFDLVPRTTLARLSRAEVQRPRGATDEPRREAEFVSSQAKNSQTFYGE